MKLLVCDIEGTIFKPHHIKSDKHASYIWTAIADQLGKKAIEEELLSQIKWSAHGYGPNDQGQAYMQWVRESIDIHYKYKLKKSEFDRIVENAEYVDGVRIFFEFLNRDKYIPIFISGVIQNLSEKACRDLGVEEDNSYAACKYYFNTNGEIDKSLTFLNTSNFYGKQELVKIALRKHGLNERDWIFIGDGVNDIDIATYASVSIGIDPIAPLKHKVDYYFNDFKDLMGSDELITDLNLLNNEPYNHISKKEKSILKNEDVDELSRQVMSIALSRVKRQVGNLELIMLENSACERIGSIFSIRHKDSFKLKARGIEKLLETGEQSYIFHSDILKEKKIVSAILQPFSNAIEIMIYVCIALMESEPVLSKLLDKHSTLKDILNDLENDDLKAVLREYIQIRNIAAHSYQKISIDVAKSFIQRTYEGIQRLELMINR